MLRLLFVILLLAAAGAYLTKPTEAEARAKATELVRNAIDTGSLDDVSEPALALLLATCKSDAAACADVLMAGIRINYVDRTLFAQVDAEGFGRSATCYAAYTRLLCPAGLLR